ncbi:hypothetical protein [Rubinisphaera margarita]|uniref:hypothetical protein n=1 Tax=Rubinisphaera margarita TaxID=2909586 RepID=UPI001EE9715D|nr:hypothetical protein [Rubinisphaera margarita]MCG6158080.1 hypothetical protein [Rubinisphaera margarita]
MTGPHVTNVSVSTGARLHCGLFSDHRPGGKLFQGFGLMIDEPGFDLLAERIDGDDHELGYSPDLINELAEEETSVPADLIRDRFLSVIERCEARWPAVKPAIAVEFDSLIPFHAGLGAGTQFDLAIGTCWAQLAGVDVAAPELSRVLGRGKRSCIGTFGFHRGGLLIDRGISPDEDAGIYRFAASLPETWRFVLVTPDQIAGYSGEQEERAFQSMPEIAPDRLDELEDLLQTIEEDCSSFKAFSETLQRFGNLVGDTFAPVQGGRFRHPVCETIFDCFEQAGIQGIAQSSWGPTMFGVCKDDDSVQAVIERVFSTVPSATVRITRAGNRGATVTPTSETE